MRKWNPAARFGDLPMERKLILIFLFLVILPIMALSLISYDRYAHTIEDNATSYVAELARKLIVSLDDYIADMERLTALPGAIEEIRDSLRAANAFYARPDLEIGDSPYIIPSQKGTALEIQRRVEDSIYFLNSVKEGATSIYLFDNFGNGYYRVQVGGVRSDIMTTYEQWLEQARREGTNAALVSTQEYTSNHNRKRYVFTVVRQIFTPSLELLGLIAVDANISVIERYVSELDAVTGGETMILDENNFVIYDSNMRHLAQNRADDPIVARAAGNRGVFRHDAEDGRRIVIYDRSDKTGWKVIISVPVSVLTKDAAANRNFTMATATMIGFLALVVSVFFSFALTRPLRSLMQLMKHVQAGNLDVSFPVRRQDEIGMLGFHFNRMINRIRELINDNYHMQLRRKEAELLALQSQINPHFLHNTLESIRMTAEVDDNPEVADMIQLLGRLLRYSVNTSGEIVRLEDELMHLETFMRIVEYRYPGRFRLEVEGCEPFREMKMVKLLLQPIVENAVLHGRDETKARMTIRLSCEETGDRIVFRVRDDGAGMDAETLERLRGVIDMPPERSERTGRRGFGIGLRNVNERIRLFYGEGYGIGIASGPGAGTEVTVTLPRRLQA